MKALGWILFGFVGLDVDDKLASDEDVVLDDTSASFSAVIIENQIAR